MDSINSIHNTIPSLDNNTIQNNKKPETKKISDEAIQKFLPPIKYNKQGSLC